MASQCIEPWTPFVLSVLAPFTLVTFTCFYPTCTVTLGKCHVLSGLLWVLHRQRRLDVVVPPLPVPCALCHLCWGWQVGEMDCAEASFDRLPDSSLGQRVLTG